MFVPWVDLELMEPRPTQGVQEHGEGLPGLRTRFSSLVAWIQVKDAHAPEVAGTIELLDGDGFSTTEDDIITMI